MNGGRKPFKPGRLLSIAGLIVSAALLIIGCMLLSDKSKDWATIWSVVMAAVVAYFAHYAIRGNK